MSAVELLERTARATQHASSRGMAKAICAATMELMREGEGPSAVHSALEQLYQRYRLDGDVVKRDAFAEAFDWFEEEVLPETA